MEVISLVGDAVLASRVPEEKAISIKTTELTMTLGRHSPDKLAGLKIEGGDGGFVLPADNETLKSRIRGTRVVDTQVKLLALTMSGRDGKKSFICHKNTFCEQKI